MYKITDQDRIDYKKSLEALRNGLEQYTIEEKGTISDKAYNKLFERLKGRYDAKRIKEMS